MTNIICNECETVAHCVKNGCVPKQPAYRAVKTYHDNKPVYVAEHPAQKRPQNCGTGYCSCIECVMEPAQPIIKSYPEKDNSAQQEPVAWLEPEWGEKICPEVGYEVTMTEDHPRDLCWVPLYPHPAQRTWVGLTDEEFQWVYDHGRTPAGMMEMVEAKLKEKNT